jgi:hypothetical protein|uniref:Uncharacterized protein n=1 Tax=viral metagenome TaxID=1070528 RepID=A0A6C0IQZ5_9ZZZZ
MSTLDLNDKMNLKNLVSKMGAEDNTDNIRKWRHSTKIRDDIRILDTLTQEKFDLRITDPEIYAKTCIDAAPFLYEHYQDLFKRMIKRELDLTIMTKLLVILRLIEDEKVDQHEGAAMFGKILKELYIDSAVKQGDNLDKERVNEDQVEKNVGKTISYKEYKKLQNKN